MDGPSSSSDGAGVVEEGRVSEHAIRRKSVLSCCCPARHGEGSESEIWTVDSSTKRDSVTSSGKSSILQEFILDF